MSVEMNVLTTQYLGEEFTFLDCPGSIEFLADTLNVLPAIDAAVVVCEPEPAKADDAAALPEAAGGREYSALALRQQDSTRRSGSLRALLAALQEASETPLLLRQIPIWENGVATGFVDLALERAFVLSPPCRQRSGRYRRLCAAKRKPASRCWNGWPIMTNI